MLREKMRKELVKAAVERRTVTYGFLMKKFGISRGSAEGDTVIGALGEIDRQEYREGAPGFACLVVRKDTGYPGGGFFCWDGVPPELRRPSGKGQDSTLTDAERAYVDRERERVWAYYGRRYATHYDLGHFAEDG